MKCKWEPKDIETVGDLIRALGHYDKSLSVRLRYAENGRNGKVVTVESVILREDTYAELPMVFIDAW